MTRVFFRRPRLAQAKYFDIGCAYPGNNGTVPQHGLRPAEPDSISTGTIIVALPRPVSQLAGGPLPGGISVIVSGASPRTRLLDRDLFQASTLDGLPPLMDKSTEKRGTIVRYLRPNDRPPVY